VDDAHYYFVMPPSIWGKKPYTSRHRMTIAYAAQHHPDAKPILDSREVRSAVGAVTADSPYQRSSSVKTPAAEVHHAWLVSRIGRKNESIDNPPHEPT
jgi:hypothetical protein